MNIAIFIAAIALVESGNNPAQGASYWDA